MCNFNNLIQSKVHKVEKIELNAQLAHPATAYSCLLIAWSDKEYHYSPPLDEMSVHHKVTPYHFVSSGFLDNSPVPIYSPGWKEAFWE